MRAVGAILSIVVSLCAGAAAAAEDSSLEFFDRDAAKTVFDDSIVVVKAGTFKDKSAEKKGDKDGAAKTREKDDRAKDGGTPFDPENTSEDDIVAEFGEPDDKLPVIAVESAPKPFKAMMRALESGHDDLAFQYARQYVRYIGHVQAQNARLMSMTGKALEREGMAEAGAFKGGPDFIEDREILERDLQKSGIAARNADLDARTREVFEDAQRAERKNDPRALPGGENSIVPSMRDDAAAQAQINGAGAAPARAAQPVSPHAGNPVDVFFFFNPQDRGAVAMAPEIESLYRSGRRINLVGFTAQNAAPGEVARYKSATRTTFPVQDGSRLAAGLKLRSFPTVVIMDNRTGRSVAREGSVTYGELDQIIKTMDAGR